MKYDSILITGACGMVGSHLVDYYFDKKNIKPIATYYKPTTDISEINHKANWTECDVRYGDKIRSLICEHKPSKIFHLAAQSYPTVSWERPIETNDINVNGTIHVFEAVKWQQKIDPNYDPVVVVACSSAEYGASLTPENVPISENTILLPLHPYGVSKVSQDLLSYQYFVNDKIKCIRARIFNTTGPRKINDVASDFAKRAVMIERGEIQTMRVGNLETKRAITDVRDLIQALLLLSDQGEMGEVYNISGQNVYQIKEIIPIIENKIGKRINIEHDPSLIRPTDEPIIFGDSTRLKNKSGWQQSYSLEQTIGDMIDYFRTK